MNALFRHGPSLKTISADGWNCLLLEDKEIIVSWGGGQLTRYLMPEGTPSDGASIPEVFAALGFTRYGVYWPAAYVHDAAYRQFLLIRNGEEWVNAKLSKEQCDHLILALMFALGVGEAKRNIIYDALIVAGKAAYDEDIKLAKSEGRI